MCKKNAGEQLGIGTTYDEWTLSIFSNFNKWVTSNESLKTPIIHEFVHNKSI